VAKLTHTLPSSNTHQEMVRVVNQLWQAIENVGTITVPAVASGKLVSGVSSGYGIAAGALTVANNTQSSPSSSSRLSSTITTASLATGATEMDTMLLSKTCEIQCITTSQPAWVRVYDNAISQSADSGRGYDNPVIYSGNGIVMDAITTITNLSIWLNPKPIFSNPNDNSTLYISITNMSGASTPVTLNITYLQMES